jgi:hypothetical protein
MSAVSTAILLANGPDLAWEDTTVLGRLEDQLRSLGVDEVHVLTRADSPDVAGDLALIADLAERAPGGVAVLSGDVVTQREALAGLLADPRIGTGVLSSMVDAGPGAHGMRSDRGRVIAAASSFHTVAAPTEWFLGALKVTAAQTDELVAAAERLSSLVRDDWGDDAAALLLVALVRDGVHVGQSDIRELFWARPRSPQEVDRARADIVGHDEERVLLDSSVKAIDGFFTTFFVSPYSKYIARWAARRGLTPNQVTAFSLLLGVVAAAAFATGERWGLVAGAVLLQVAFTTDCVDGQLARFTRTPSTSRSPPPSTSRWTPRPSARSTTPPTAPPTIEWTLRDPMRRQLSTRRRRRPGGRRGCCGRGGGSTGRRVRSGSSG